MQHQIIHHLPQLINRRPGQFSVMRILIHPVLPDFRRIRPVHRIDDHIRSIPLPARQHTANQRLCDLRHIHFLKLAQAVRTIPAVIRSVLPKIPENIIPQAFIRKAVEGHLPQPVPVPLRHQIPGERIHLLVVLVMVDKELVRHHVLPAVQQNTLRRFPVSSGPAGFLIVAFHIFRHIIMNDVPDIGFINSHSKGIGSHHNGIPVINKIVLILSPLAVT